MRKIVLSVLCLLVSVFTLAGCSNNSEPFEEKTYTPDTQISEINLDVRDREIEVALSSDEQVYIQYSENSKEYYEIAVSDENVLTMTSASDKEWTDYIGGKASAEARKILLQIPDTLLENLTLSTTSYDDFAIQTEIKKGDSNLPDNKTDGTKTLNVSSNNGDINIEFVKE